MIGFSFSQNRLGCMHTRLTPPELSLYTTLFFYVFTYFLPIFPISPIISERGSPQKDTATNRLTPPSTIPHEPLAPRPTPPRHLPSIATMAIRPICGRIRPFAMAAAASRARAPPVERDTARRLLSRFQVARTASAAAAAAGQQANPCAVTRAVARSVARTGDIAACAKARAHAAHDVIIGWQRQGSAAGSVAAFRLERAHYRFFSNILWVAYGESAPKTPSPLEVFEKTLVLVNKVRVIWNLVKSIDDFYQWFQNLDPYLQAFIISLFISPLEDLYEYTLEYFNDLVKNIVPTAQEPSCPFLGLKGLPFEEYAVTECLAAVVDLCTSSGSVIAMGVVGLAGCFFLDILCQLRILHDTPGPVPVNPSDYVEFSSVVQFSGMKKFKKLTLEVVAKMLSEEEIGTLMKLFKNGYITVEEVKDAIKRVGTQLSSNEIEALFADVDDSLGIGFGEFVFATLLKTEADIDVLLDLTKGKTPEEIRKTFNIKIDIGSDKFVGGGLHHLL